MSDKFDVTFKAASWEEVRKLIEAVATSGVGEVVICRTPRREVVTTSGLPQRFAVANEYTAPERVHAADITRQFNAHAR